MAQQQIKNVNRVQLDYMKKKLSDYTSDSSNILKSIKEQASGLKDSNLKESLKEGTNKLKGTSK
jgi:t-SNARE complex subunit (syntaxin)